MAKPNHLMSALADAKARGYIHDLFLTEDGEFVLHSEEVVTPKIIEIIQCHHCGATLYLVAGETHSGTWIHHWII